MPDAATNIDQEQHSNYAVFYRLLQRVASIEIPLAADPDYLVVGPFNREGVCTTRCWRRARSG